MSWENKWMTAATGAAAPELGVQCGGERAAIDGVGSTFIEPLENVSGVARSGRVLHVRQALLEIFCARAALLQLAVLLAQALRYGELGVIGLAQIGDDGQKLAANECEMMMRG